MRGQQGFSLMELVIASSLSILLGWTVIHLYLQSTRAAETQSESARTVEQSVQLHHLLSHLIRDALLFDNSGMLAAQNEQQCEGLFLSGRCLPPVMVWTAGTAGPVTVPASVPGSSVLLARQHCCEDVRADLFYLAERSSGEGGSALYRRRLLTDGRVAAADEMIPDVLSLQFLQVRLHEAQVVMNEPLPFAEQWNALAWRVQAEFFNSDNSLLFTVAARQGH